MACRAPARPAGRTLALSLALACLPLEAGADGTTAGPAPRPGAAAPTARSVPAKPGPGDKCPVCGMFVAKYPDWAAAIVYEDGRIAWFDGAKDLFTYLLQPELHRRPAGTGQVERILVTDYYSVTPVEGRSAWFVIGSDVFGPMGAELVPFAREADAREFLADHRGKGLLRYGDVGPATLRELQGSP